MLVTGILVWDFVGEPNVDYRFVFRTVLAFNALLTLAKVAMTSQINIRNHGNLPRELDKRRDKIMSILSNHPLDSSCMGVEVIYANFKGEVATTKCNFYRQDGWFFA